MWPTEERPWYGSFVRSQAESLRRLGVSVDVHPIRGHESRLAYAAAIPALRRRTRRAGAYDLVHAHYGHSGLVARLAAPRLPLVLSYCGDDLLGTRDATGALTPRSRVEAAVFRRLARACDATITKSREMEERLPASARARNHVIPNGVDLERFAPVPRDEARSRLGWGGERVVLFAADPAVATKNHALAAAAVERLGGELPDVRLHVASGTPPDEMPLVMSAADALVLTSRSEGSPNVVKEAMAAELPVVATPVGDVRERIGGVDGCHVKPPEPDAIAAGLAAALRSGRSPEARRAVAAIGLERVAERILAVYEEAVARHAGRRRRGA
jgi:glycosyltransferase involved in cell wall biosynthesis